jgi:uncharacterized SAM-binding protein YcdF (DUF218 family)
MHTCRLRRADADALIVLGYRCDNDEMHPLLKERLDTAIQLFRQYRYRFIILSGGAVKSKLTEAEIMRDYLVAHGVPVNRLLLESRSRNTVHNIVNCKLLLEQHGMQTCLLVSNSFHIRRMGYIMKAFRIPAALYATRHWRSIFTMQWKLTFQEIRAFRLTLPWLEQAMNMKTLQIMGSKKGAASR